MVLLRISSSLIWSGREIPSVDLSIALWVTLSHFMSHSEQSRFGATSQHWQRTLVQYFGFKIFEILQYFGWEDIGAASRTLTRRLGFDNWSLSLDLLNNFTGVGLHNETFPEYLNRVSIFFSKKPTFRALYLQVDHGWLTWYKSSNNYVYITFYLILYKHQHLCTHKHSIFFFY